jgi:type IV secretory pathway protease TraF
MTRATSKTLRVSAALLSVAALQAATSAWAAPPAGVEVTVNNSATEPVPIWVVHPVSTTPVSPGEPFTIAPKQATQVVAGGPIAPDPSGTRYAITSLTGVNTSAEPVTILTRAVAVGGVQPDCRFVFNQEDTTDGPEIRIPANDTVHIAFPQPFVTAAVTGTEVCLVAAGNPSYIGIKWSVTGYKILP